MVFASTQLPPVFRRLSSEEPRSSPLSKPMDFLAQGFPCWLQRHPRQDSTTEHEERFLAGHTDRLKGPSNQRIKQCLRNHLARFPLAGKSEAGERGRDRPTMSPEGAIVPIRDGAHLDGGSPEPGGNKQPDSGSDLDLSPTSLCTREFCAEVLEGGLLNITKRRMSWS